MILLALALLQDLPDAPAKKQIEKMCGKCHGLNFVTSKRRTRSEWLKTIDDMAGKGLEASDEDLGAALEYFTKFFGKISVNYGSAEDIANVLDLTAKEAAIVVKYREENGPFKTIESVTKVPGLDPAKMEARKDRMLLK